MDKNTLRVFVFLTVSYSNTHNTKYIEFAYYLYHAYIAFVGFIQSWYHISISHDATHKHPFSDNDNKQYHKLNAAKGD